MLEDDQSVRRLNMMMCVWSGPLFVVLLFAGWGLVAGFLPPPEPSATGEQIAAMYHADANMIRIGMALVMSAGGFFAPWIAVTYVLMRRIEGSGFPVLSMTQALAGTYGIVTIIIPAMIWTTAAFRPERDAELILMLNDLGWLNLTMIYSPAFVQTVAIGLVFLQDKRARPLFPRWLGFFNIWVAVLYLPAILISSFKQGPFAWNGVIAFWIPAIAFLAWFIVLARYMIIALDRELVGEGAV